MRQNLLPLLLLCLLAACKKDKEPKQEPIPNNQALSWIKTYGGTNYDFANAVVQLSGGEYIVAGTTRSVDGDLSGSRVGYDAWLTKLDASGNKVWMQVYGENNDDYATSLVATSDGGFLMTGFTFVSDQNYAWVLKTDGNGNKQWQKTLSTSTDAKPFSILATNDNNFLISGYTSNQGNRDGWITKIDASGNHIWTKTFGGTAEDQFTSALKLSDGSIVLSGFSKSGNGDLAANSGNSDGWILKIDASGNKLWSRNFGGSDEDVLNGAIVMSDGGIVLAGNTLSRNGDIPLNKGGSEEWLIKLDASGNKQWVKTYGGANEEYITSIVNTHDGGFITMGYTNSTTGDVFRPNNNFSGWLLKLDASGNKVAASTYGHTAIFDDRSNTLIPTSDGGYLIGGYSWVENHGYDAWLVKIDNL